MIYEILVFSVQGMSGKEVGNRCHLWGYFKLARFPVRLTFDILICFV